MLTGQDVWEMSRRNVELNRAAMLSLALGLPYHNGMVDVTDARIPVETCALCECSIDRKDGALCLPCATNAWEHAESFGGLLPVKIARYRKWIERQLEAKGLTPSSSLGSGESHMIEGRA